MSVFVTPNFDEHELVAFCTDKSSGLKSIIAIHNTNRGPALGGCRFWDYKSESAAIEDVLRLSRGMTYKAALANLNLGGGKGVIFGDSTKDKTPEKLRAFGRFVEKLHGYYITAEDVGTSPDDMAQIRKETKYVVGTETNKGGSGDPSIMTAYGVYQGIKASVFYKYGITSLKGVRITLQGLGHVGMLLCKHLYSEGAILSIYDINNDKLNRAIDEFSAIPLNEKQLFSSECDVFSPCALGGFIDEDFIENFKGKIIAGAANNQLLTATHGDILRQKGILYAPDYVINAGGLINVSYEGPNYNAQVVKEHVEGIYQTLLEILKIADEKNISTNKASDQIAEERFQKMPPIQNTDNISKFGT